MTKTLTQNSLWEEVSVYLLEFITEEVQGRNPRQEPGNSNGSTDLEQSLLACFLILPVQDGIAHRGLSPPTSEGTFDGGKLLTFVLLTKMAHLKTR